VQERSSRASVGRAEPRLVSSRGSNALYGYYGYDENSQVTVGYDGLYGTVLTAGGGPTRAS